EEEREDRQQHHVGPRRALDERVHGEAGVRVDPPQGGGGLRGRGVQEQRAHHAEHDGGEEQPEGDAEGAAGGGGGGRGEGHEGQGRRGASSNLGRGTWIRPGPVVCAPLPASRPPMTAVRPPEFFPRLAYAALLLAADRFVVADTFPFSRQAWHNRTRIRTPEAPGWQWLTVPRRHAGKGAALRAVPLDGTEPWARTHARALRYNYGMAPF